MQGGRIFRKKKELKAKKVGIKKILAKLRIEALGRAPKEFEFYDAWTKDGKIVYKNFHNKIKNYYD